MLSFDMRIAVIGPSGSGKTWLSARLAESLGLRHIEIDALHHGPNWAACSTEELHERVMVATEGDDWVSDGTYHQMIGELVFERVETVAWLDLPVRLVTWRLLPADVSPKEARNGALAREPRGPWAESLRYLIWPSVKRGFENRRRLPALFARHPHLLVHRLRSDRDVHEFTRTLRVERATL
jgi:adenylate kinase family enzyme